MADVFGNGSERVSSIDNVLHRSEVTVLGVGNVIQLVDGGTLGIELTQYVTGTNKLLVIDSINGGADPGTMFCFHNDNVMEHFQDKLSAHEVGIQDVLGLLTVTGHKIPEVIVIGAQPFDLEAGVELSAGMQKLLPQVVETALEKLRGWGIEPVKKKVPDAMDFGVVAEEVIRTRG